MAEPVGAVMVIGGGISGMQSSLDLANSGFKVYLVERGPSIGGVMSQLDKTFPTNDCAMCIMAPKLVETGRHENIELITNAEVEMIDGRAGNFLVTLKKYPRRINEETCTGCGVCAEKCPTEAIDEFNEGLKHRKAVYVRYPQSVPLVYMIDREKCIGCGICEGECKAGAIEYDEKEKILEINVGSIVLSPGSSKFDPSVRSEYGYGIFKNVLTSLEFERMLSATGPHLGTVVRPSDGDIPKKIAWIQCVGSRDKAKGNSYCSAVCCMYSLKEAIIAKEHFQGIEPTIFFMDMRAYGKDFEKYYIRAEDEAGVRFVRSRVSGVEEDPETKDLTVSYVENGEVVDETFNMVVLSIAMNAPEEAEILSHRLGFKLNIHKFVKAGLFEPLDTTKPGIFVGGAFAGPKDIPGTVAEASGAAARAANVIATSRDSLTKKKEYPAEIDVSEQEPRIGVFVCHCGINIGSVVDVPAVVEYAKTLPNVVYADENLFTCSDDTQTKMKEIINEQKLNRVIVASCSPRTHEPLFQETCRQAGLNQYLFEMANIRDQCSWVHMHEKEEATEKSKDLVRMVVAKSALLDPLQKSKLPVTKSALVIGGGLSGMTAASGLADQGFDVHLVEREKELGGNLRRIQHLLSDVDPQKKLEEIISKVKDNPKVNLHIGSKIEKIEGRIGNFTTTLEGGETIEHGVVIVATGGVEHKPTEYLYGENPNVMTQLEFEEKLTKGEIDLEKSNKIAMIQCVGSRNEERPNCSRICCSEAVKNALKIKEKNPDAEVYVLYKDIRTYGFNEDYFQEASEKGVLFVRYDDDNTPIVNPGQNGLEITLKDPVLDEVLRINADLLILSVPVLPQPDSEDVGRMLKVPLTKDNFFLEAHMKLRPVDFATEGVFLCGLAHGPKFVDESIAQACGAVARAATVLSKDEIEIEPTISHVVDENCDGCAYCIEPCPYDAITLIEYMKNGSVKKTVDVDESACKGCGCCQATCPKEGIFIWKFKLDQLNAMIDACLGVA
ncbi:MAG: CoB--CoM heterodisulfide reductase iron-sulfur subunit A family protein [Methanomassiliicoccales archaeon]|nr:MAG: CoB--CoM heterodisulfide reductase iron-sulfur subunit A family protein [Methanomassiliicoccales archaeon]